MLDLKRADTESKSGRGSPRKRLDKWEARFGKELPTTLTQRGAAPERRAELMEGHIKALLAREKNSLTNDVKVEAPAPQRTYTLPVPSNVQKGAVLYLHPERAALLTGLSTWMVCIVDYKSRSKKLQGLSSYPELAEPLPGIDLVDHALADFNEVSRLSYSIKSFLTLQ